MNSKGLSVFMLIFFTVSLLNGVSSLRLMNLHGVKSAYIAEIHYPQSEMYQASGNVWNFTVNLIIHNVNCSEDALGRPYFSSSSTEMRKFGGTSITIQPIMFGGAIWVICSDLVIEFLSRHGWVQRTMTSKLSYTGIMRVSMIFKTPHVSPLVACFFFLLSINL